MTRRPGPWLILVLLLMAGVGANLWYGQNVLQHDGGHISDQKAYWFALAVTLFIWLPAFFALDRRVAETVRRIYAVHAILWVIRAVVELWLMYGVHLWIPPYGVIHNIVSFLLMSALMFLHRHEVRSFQDPATLNAIRYTRVMRVAMLCECTFATMFYHTVLQETTHTWFANTEPRFWLINQMTTVADVVLTPWVFLTVRDYYRASGGSTAS